MLNKTGKVEEELKKINPAKLYDFFSANYRLTKN